MSPASYNSIHTNYLPLYKTQMTMTTRLMIGTALMLVLLSACKTKKHATTQEYKRDSITHIETSRANITHTDSVRVTTQQEERTDSYQIIEQYDSLGRLSTRVIRAKIARQRKQTDSLTHASQAVELITTKEVQAVKEYTKAQEVSSESKPATASLRWYICILIVGIGLGGYLVWRYRGDR